MSLADLRGSIDERTARLAVIGLGYVGLPVACEFARAGFDVLGVDIVPVPGPSEAVTALVMSGLPAAQFTYLCAVPPSSEERRELLRGVASECPTVVLSAAACDLAHALEDVREVLGDRRIAVYADGGVWRGRTGDTPAQLSDGACTVVVEGAQASPTWTSDRVRDEARALLAAGVSRRDVAREVAQRSGWARRTVYGVVLELARGEG